MEHLPARWPLKKASSSRKKAVLATLQNRSVVGWAIFFFHFLIWFLPKSGINQNQFIFTALKENRQIIRDSFRMTSTNFNVGLNDTRNSSRVLRPPGGGHTDIFGSGNAEPAVKRDNRRNASSILEGTNTGAVASSPVKAPTSGSSQVGSQSVPTEPARTNNRVPPGGFSSGLW